MFCKNCGKQIDDNAEICPLCGVRAKYRPSKLWYVLVLFGIIGGIIGYIFLKDKDKSMAINIFVIGTVINILGLISNTDQPKTKNADIIQQESPIVRETLVQTPIPIQTTIIPVSTPAIPEGDKKFIAWMSDSSTIITNDLQKLTEASKNYDLRMLEIYGDSLKRNTEKYSGEITEFSVSSQLLPVLYLYLDALNDYHIAGEKTEEGARDIEAKDIESAANYLKWGNEHIKEATNIMNKYPATITAETKTLQMERTTITKSGIGQKDRSKKEDTDKFYLSKGLARFDMTHDGNSNFAVWLMDDKDNRIDLIANDIGNFQGFKVIRIKSSGKYYLNIFTDGNWNIITTNIFPKD